MCGIVGIMDVTGARTIDRDLVSRLNETQHHRGPDEVGIHMEPGVGLGHRRLSIIDLSTGQQPLANEDGSVVIVYNGEIYNYRELISELAGLGHVFRTKSDTEAVVHAWEQWGEDCVTRFRGMFAFALWDRNRETLFLARDRLGVKPLHYALLPNGHFVLGSELKSLVAHPAFGRELDPFAIEEYFALGYVPEPRTIYVGAKQACPRSHAHDPPRPARSRAARVLGCEVHARQFDRRARCRSGAHRPAAGIGEIAHDRGSSARRVSVGRCGFERGGGDDGRRERGPGEYVLDLVFGSRVRRDAVCETSRRPIRHAAFCRHRGERRFRSRRCSCADLRRAVRGQLGIADLPGMPARAEARHRRIVRRRRRRELRGLPAIPAARDGRAIARRDAAVGPASRVRHARPHVSEGRLGPADVPGQVDVSGAGADVDRRLLP